MGHTKFFPDAGFGMLKRKFRVTNVGYLNGIATVVQKSATMNHAQLVDDQQGNVIVPSYDWAEFFQGRTKKNALKASKMAHFRFSADSPGYVHVKKSSSDATTEQKIKLVKDISGTPDMSSLPDGLSVKRQWYLYNKVHEFCPEEFRDLVCPLARKRLLPSDDESFEDE